MEHCLRYWPYRCGAESITTYLKDIDVDWSNPKPETEEGLKDALLMMELYINLLHWASVQDFQDKEDDEFNISLSKTGVEYETERLIANAEYILEQCCNMHVREFKPTEKSFPQYRISKRDSRVDIAIEAVPELADVLLGYLDVRNADSRKYKESALTAIYGYLEPKRKEYKGLSCSSVCDEFFASMNSFGIRHTKSQIRLQGKKRIAVYDKLFKMGLYVLQATDVEEYKQEMKALREKKSEQ